MIEALTTAKDKLMKHYLMFYETSWSMKIVVALLQEFENIYRTSYYDIKRRNNDLIYV